MWSAKGFQVRGIAGWSKNGNGSVCKTCRMGVISDDQVRAMGG